MGRLEVEGSGQGIWRESMKTTYQRMVYVHEKGGEGERGQERRRT